MLRDTVKIYLRLSQDKLASDGFMPRVQLDKNLVEETRKFYANKAMTIVDSTSLVDYLKETARSYSAERHRTLHIFNWEVDEEILNTFRAEMLVKP